MDPEFDYQEKSARMLFFESLQLLPKDAVLENVRNAFIADESPMKVDLGAGIYRDEKGADYVHLVVQKVSLSAVISRPFNPPSGIQDRRR